MADWGAALPMCRRKAGTQSLLLNLLPYPRILGLPVMIAGQSGAPTFGSLISKAADIAGKALGAQYL